MSYKPALQYYSQRQLRQVPFPVCWLSLSQKWVAWQASKVGGDNCLLHSSTPLAAHDCRWIFLIEGVVTVVLGVMVFFILVDSPTRSTSWLTDEEIKYLVLRKIQENGGHKIDARSVSELALIVGFQTVTPLHFSSTNLTGASCGPF